MISSKTLHGKKSENKTLVFDALESVDLSKGQSVQNPDTCSICYNISTANKELRTGYGFRQLQMPVDRENLDNEEVVRIKGSDVQALWAFKFYDSDEKLYYYTCMYYTSDKSIPFFDLFGDRKLDMVVLPGFSTCPVGCTSLYKGEDCIIFSGEKDGIYVVTNEMSKQFENLPHIFSIATMSDYIFAISDVDPRKLIYTLNKEITEWNEKNIIYAYFDDERGKLHKVLALDDYIFVIREYGISKLNMYSTRATCDIVHVYQSDSYIYPGTIASSGDKVFFVDGKGVKFFNGSNVTSLKLGCEKLLANADKRFASAVCFEGKYYLSCRVDFADGQKVGCENGEYINNALFVIDTNGDNVDILRGVDIKGLCALLNPYKSKVVACFNGENNCYIGELVQNGQVFGQSTLKVWANVSTDLGYPERYKKCKYISIKSLYPCSITIESEKEKRTYNIFASESLQRIAVNTFGKQIKLTISSDCENVDISSIKLGYSVI